MSKGNVTYLGNSLLKNVDVKMPWTKDQIQEYVKCQNDPIYFIKQYIKIIHVDKGLIPFELYDYEEKMVNIFHTKRFAIIKMPRQSGKSITVISFLLHYILFHRHVRVAVLANKGQGARDLLGRLQLAYEHLPQWLQQGTVTWNKSYIELENGSAIVAASTSASGVRGGTYNCIFLDEFAHIGNTLAEEFFTSTYPVISSGKSTKVFIISTPLGMNMFYKMWEDAQKKEREAAAIGQETKSYVTMDIHWSATPGRDQAWYDEQVANMTQEKVDQEFNCVSGDTKVTINNGEEIKTYTLAELYEKLSV